MNQKEKLQEATIKALQNKLIESIYGYKLNAHNLEYGREDCDVYISCTVSGTEEGTLECIIPCIYNTTTNKFEPSQEDINFIYPNDGDEANPEYIDYKEIMNKIPSNILNKLNKLEDPDIAYQNYIDKKTKEEDEKNKELKELLTKLSLNIEDYNETQIWRLKNDLFQGVKDGLSDDQLKLIANPNINDQEYADGRGVVYTAIKQCIDVKASDKEIFKIINTFKYSDGDHSQRDKLGKLAYSTIKSKYGLSAGKPDDFLFDYYIKAINQGIPLELLQEGDKKLGESMEPILESIINYNAPLEFLEYAVKNDYLKPYLDEFYECLRDYSECSIDISKLKYAEEKLASITVDNTDFYYRHIPKRIIYMILADQEKDYIEFYIQTINKYPFSRSYDMYWYLRKYYNKGLTIDTLQTILEKSINSTDPEAYFRRKCNQYIKLK